MTTTHDDLPHPIPPIAYLRYKENYFFILMSEADDIYGIFHFNNEPGFSRSRMSCDLRVKGEKIAYSNEVALPEDFGRSPTISDGTLTLTIHESHKRFGLVLNGADFALDLTFSDRFATFDFSACKYAAPELASFRDVMTFGMNLPFEHLQQGMTVKGSFRTPSGARVSVDGLAYRDHSWGVRCDNTVAWHTWSVFNFPERVFGIMTLETKSRSGIYAKEGYVMDADGARALRVIDAKPIDFTPGQVLPAKMIYEVADAFGQRYTLEGNVAARLSQVLLVPESSQSKTPYTVTENFCHIRLAGDDIPGIGLIELGYNPEWPNPFY